ncbi:hypothetical protein J1784_00225, partial [Rahnella sp. FRB 231]|nr:hypothetical protein [Rahnella ecdela]
FKAFSQFSRKGFKFLFIHNLPVSVAGVNISKTGNYTILITVSIGLHCPHIHMREAIDILPAQVYGVSSKRTGVPAKIQIMALLNKSNFWP